MEKKTIPVIGMACAGCAANVEKRLRQLEGIASANVNFAARTALVEYDPKVITPQTMKEEIAKAGYDLVINENESVEVLQPDLAAVRVGEGVEAFLEDAEGLFVAVVLFEIGGVVQNVLRREERGRKEYLRRDDVEIEHAIVGSARGVHRADALFHVQKQVPESVRLVDAFLDRLVAFSREGEYAWHATRESRQSLKESESESGIGWREREREDLGEVSRDK